MSKKEDTPAKQAVIREWDIWAAKHKDDADSLRDGMLFFNYLQKEKPDLLDFKYSGSDKWQCVHGWLLRERRVKN